MFALKSVVKMPKGVQVEWEDGLLASFNYLWLHDNSQKRPDILHLKLNSKPESINVCKESLNVVWPPYLASDYSSEFLRENALRNLFTAETERYQIASNSIVDYDVFESNNFPASTSQEPIPAEEASILSYSGQAQTTTYGKSTSGDHIWSIVEATPLNPKSVVGQVFWPATACEPGTVWPHLQQVPTICAVDTLNNTTPARILIVDTYKALSTLSKKYPMAFEFLAQHVLEYSEGVFCARHSTCRVINGKIYPGVFNNAARSCAITAKPLERFYESLQKFGRVCIESAQIIELPPGKRLLIDNSRAMIGAPAQSGRSLVLRCLS